MDLYWMLSSELSIVMFPYCGKCLANPWILAKSKPFLRVIFILVRPDGIHIIQARTNRRKFHFIILVYNFVELFTINLTPNQNINTI